MNKPALPRLAAACGAVFAVVLTAANGTGSHPFSVPREIAGIAALTLALPFIAYLCGLLLEAETANGRWLVSTALGTGVAAITLKLASAAPEIALHNTHLTTGSGLHGAIEAVAGGATVLSLYPLAIFCTATAITAFRSHAIPRWLATGAAITAAALAVNGAFLATSAVPALLLFTLWTLVTSTYLLLRASRQPTPAPQAQTATQP